MFFLLLSVVPVSASVFGQDAKVSLQVEKASLEKVMSILEKSTDYRFVYQNSQVESVGNLTLNFKDSDIRDVMTECLKGSGLTFSVVGVNVVIVPLGEKPQVPKEDKKEKQVKGRVTDKEGLPLPGVSVLIDLLGGYYINCNVCLLRFVAGLRNQPKYDKINSDIKQDLRII